jgi:hypothetical protein
LDWARVAVRCGGEREGSALWSAWLFGVSSGPNEGGRVVGHREVDLEGALSVEGQMINPDL